MSSSKEPPRFPSPRTYSHTYELATQMNNLHLSPGTNNLPSPPRDVYNASFPIPNEKPLPSLPPPSDIPPIPPFGHRYPPMQMPTPSYFHPEFLPIPPATGHYPPLPDVSSPMRPVPQLLTRPSQPQPASASTSSLIRFPEVSISSSHSSPSGARRRAASVPPPVTQSDNNSTVQCGGTTKAGKQCTRQVKAPPLASYLEPGAVIERFCFQHAKELLEPTGFYSRKKKDFWVQFDDWIPGYLQPETKVALRVEMEKAPSTSDVSGYIYCFEIRNPKTPNHVHLKVGRAVNLVKRIDEWGKQCGSKEVVLRGWWPGTVEGDQTSLLKGKVRAGEKGSWSHRLERLIHLELADLALHTPYLSPNFHKKSASTTSLPTKAKTPSASALVRMSGKPCPDCGTIHKEIFTFEKAKDSKLKGREWEGLVQLVIEKWGGFVENLV